MRRVIHTTNPGMAMIAKIQKNQLIKYSMDENKALFAGAIISKK